MAEELRISERPELRHPILITAFRGWNDGGQGASLAAGYLAKAWQAARFADIDPEEFYDFQVARPHVSLVDGVTRKLDWPENAFYHAPIPGGERDRPEADRAVRPAGLPLRGADGHRRRPPRHLPAGRARLRQPLGRRAAL